MIADTVDRDDELLDLRETLAVSARHATDAQIAWYAVAGCVSSASALLFRPFAWPMFAAVGGAIGAFGVWGAVDRELRDRPGLSRGATFALLAVRGLAAVVGIAGALTLLFLLLGVALGTMKS